MLNDNPLLAMLGRKGRGAVVEVLRRSSRKAWGIRELAQFAAVDPMTASRAVGELEALGAVEVRRRGRDVEVRWRPDSVAGAWLSAIEAPELA